MPEPAIVKSLRRTATPPLESCAFDAVSKRLYVAGLSYGLGVLDNHSQTLVKTRNVAYRVVRFDNQQKQLFASCSYNDPCIDVLALDAKHVKMSLYGHRQDITGIAFDQTGDAFSIDMSGLLIRWDTKKRSVSKSVELSSVLRGGISIDDRGIVAAMVDEGVVFLNRDLSLLKSIRNKSWNLSFICESPERGRVFLVDDSRKSSIIETDGRSASHVADPPSGETVAAIALLKDHRLIAGMRSGSVYSYDLVQLRWKNRLFSTGHTVTDIVLSQDRSQVFITSGDSDSGSIVQVKM